jgi:hypothetical protein
MEVAVKMDVEQLQKVITGLLQEQWTAQGHAMTSSIIEQIEYEVKKETDWLVLKGFMPKYGPIIAAGTKASRIPFSGRTGKGGTSKYIQALQSYVQQRMNISDEKKSLSVAFAIAHSQKKHGMPTPGSYSFSSTGKRTEWIGEALKSDKLTEAVREMMYGYLSMQINTMIDIYNVELNKE